MSTQSVCRALNPLSRHQASTCDLEESPVRTSRAPAFVRGILVKRAVMALSIPILPRSYTERSPSCMKLPTENPFVLSVPEMWEIRGPFCMNHVPLHQLRSGQRYRHDVSV